MARMSQISESGRPVPSIPGYDITAHLASSSTTETWEALQISLDRKVALLTPRADALEDAGAVTRFEELSRAFARLHHRNFIQVIDISRSEGGVPYAVLERLEGETLSAVLREEGALDPARAAKFVCQLAEALDSAWKQSGFVFRNLKPSAFVVQPDDTIKIAGFQSAVLVRPGENPLEGDDGMLVGTPNYMPPEQIEMSRSIDFHADMYAVGATFYQMLTGKEPFAGEEDPMQVLEMQKTGHVAYPTDVNPGIPSGYSHIVLRLMAKRPADRYAFWQDVAEDLQRVLGGRPPYVPPGGTWTPPESTVAPPAKRAAAPSRPAPGGVPGRRLVVGAGGAKAGGAKAGGAAAGKPRIVIGKAAAGAAAPAPAADPTAPGAPDAGGGTRKATAVPPTSASAPAKGGGKVLMPKRSPAALAAAKAKAGASGASGDAKGKGAKKLPFWLSILPPVGVAAVFLFVANARVNSLERKAPGLSAEQAAALAPAAGEAGAPAAAPSAGDEYEEGNPFAPGADSDALPPADGGDDSAAAPAAGGYEEGAPFAGGGGGELIESPSEEADPGLDELLASDSASAGPEEPAAPAEPEPYRALTPFQDLVLEAYESIKGMSFEEATAHMQSALAQAAQQHPDDARRFNLLRQPFHTAAPWSDLVGLALVDNPKERDIRIGTSTFRVRPTGYANGSLKCDIIKDGNPIRGRALNLRRMDPKEMYRIMKTIPVDTSYSALYSRGLLTLREGTPDEFRIFFNRFRDKLRALEPFLEAHTLKR